jgi:putative transposase
MKRSKLREHQIVTMLSEADAGIPAVELVRKYKVANSTFYKLKAKYGGMAVSDLRRLKALEEENYKLKQMYADMSLEHRILKEVIELCKLFTLMSWSE